MKNRIIVSFQFQGKPYEANVMITENEEGYNYIVNLFSKELNQSFPPSFTFIAKHKKFLPERSLNTDTLELVDAIKDAIKFHPENPYPFVD